MNKVAGILDQVAVRLMDAFSLPEDRVLFDPRPVELPATGDYAAYRCELVNGKWEAGAYDTMLLRVDVAGELADPGVQRAADRLAILGAARDRLTPTFDSFTVFPEIPGWEVPVMTEAMVQAVEDAPGRLFIGFTVEGEVTLGRGGYAG